MITAFDSWDTELYHHGILGQKWGVRRFQNKDGSLTQSGRKRQRLKDMSDEEIKAKINRLQLEKQYRELNKSGISRAFQRFEQIQEERARWRKNKADLILAKVSRSKLPLRNALQSIPAGFLKTITGHANKLLDTSLNGIEKGFKESWDNRDKNIVEQLGPVGKHSPGAKKSDDKRAKEARSKRSRSHYSAE